MIAERYIVIFTPAPHPYAANTFVQGYVGVDFDGMILNPRPAGQEPPVADIYDVIVPPDSPKPAPFFYRAQMEDNGTVTVIRDLFGPGDIKHTFAGWPIPGEEVEQSQAVEKQVAGLKVPKIKLKRE